MVMVKSKSGARCGHCRPTGGAAEQGKRRRSGACHALQQPEFREVKENGNGTGRSAAELLDSGGRFRRRALIFWPKGRPHAALIVIKPNHEATSAMARQIADWLKGQAVEVLVEQKVQASEMPDATAFSPTGRQPDFCITLGGDGTVLYAASLFRASEGPLPPVVAFAMGTLGFLTPFDVHGFKRLLQRVLDANSARLFCTLRTRLRCEVYHGVELGAVEQAFNEALLDRGSSMSCLKLNCFIDGYYVTTMQADGLIVATPSGSTAYSMSAGGPMVAPSVPCILMTPIAPHSLSFRPLVVSETSDIVIHVPQDSSVTARVSFDGKNVHMLGANDSLRLSVSKWPLPMITAAMLDQDWYEGIKEKLMWNTIIKKDRGREQQTPVLPFPAECSITDSCLHAEDLCLPDCVQWPSPRQDLIPDGAVMPVYQIPQISVDQDETRRGG